MSLANNDGTITYTKKKKTQINTEEEVEILRMKEYENNLEQKQILIKKEFEKNQIQYLINKSDPSKLNEAKLRTETDKLIAENDNKFKELLSLRERLTNLEISTNIAASYTDIHNKNANTNASANANNNTFNLSNYIFHTSKISVELIKKIKSSHFAHNEIIKPEYLIERLTNLKEVLHNLDNQIDTEKELTKGIYNKLNELTQDNNLLKKRTQELKLMKDHADKRFQNLGKIEFVAKSKFETTRNDLIANTKVLDDYRKKEINFLQVQKSLAETESKKLTNLQENISKMLISIEENKKKREEYEQKLEELDQYHEIMLNKRESSKLVSNYIDILQELEKKFIENAEKESMKSNQFADLRNKSVSAQSKKSLISLTAHRKASIQMPIYASRFLSSIDSPKLRSKTPVESSSLDNNATKSLFVNITTKEKHHIVYKINQFYHNHPDGPAIFADTVIKKYRELVFQDLSMKNIYEDMAYQKLKKQELLNELSKELHDLKKNNKKKENIMELNSDDSQNTTTTNIDNNEVEDDDGNNDQNSNLNIDIDDDNEALNPGVIIMNNMVSTINQAEIDLQNINDSKESLFIIEAFSFGIYLKFIELLVRYSRYIQAISESSGGIVPLELEKLAMEVINYTNEFNIGKKIKDKISIQIKFNESLTQNRLETHSSIPADMLNIPIPIQSSNIDAIEIKQILMQCIINWLKTKTKNTNQSKYFSKFAESLTEIIRQDSFLITFLMADDFKTYFTNKLNNAQMPDEAMDAMFNNLVELKNGAIKVMLQNLKVMLKYYTEFIEKLLNYINEFKDYFSKKDQPINIDPETILTKFELTDNIKRIYFQKCQLFNLEYLNSRKKDDTWKNDTDHSIKKNKPKDDLKNMDITLLKSKINEIANVQSKKIQGMYSVNNYNSELKGIQNSGTATNQLDDSMIYYNDEKFLEDQRKKARKNLDFNDNYEEELKNRREKIEQEKRRLSNVNDNSELKKMIKNSQILQKITLLEKKKSPINAKNSLKSTFIENYIPSMPKSPQALTLCKERQGLRIKTDFKSDSIESTPLTPNTNIFLSKSKDESNILLTSSNSLPFSKFKDEPMSIKNLAKEKNNKANTINEFKINTKKISYKSQKTANMNVRLTLSPSDNTNQRTRLSSRIDLDKKNSLLALNTNRLSTNHTDSLPEITTLKSLNSPKINKYKKNNKKDLTKIDNDIMLPTFFTTTYSPDIYQNDPYRFDLFKSEYKSLLVQKPELQGYI